MQNNSTIFPTKLKICGLTCPRQALKCFELGADWLGFNCWHGSSRYITPAEILEIMEFIPNSVITVGVFVNESPDSLQEIMYKTGMNMAQLHGDETLEYIHKIKVPWFKAFRLTPEFKTKQIQSYGKETFLVDSYIKGKYGGSGKTLNWEEISNFSKLGKLILAGGLDPENIAEAVKKVRPWGVDVCSGVESEPGIKDMTKVANFVKNLRNFTKF